MSRKPQPAATFRGRSYKVRGKIGIPDLEAMQPFAALQWLCRHTYATGYSRPNPLAGFGGAISVGVKERE